MYTRFDKNWMKHIDFILVDCVCLHLSYLISYILEMQKVDLYTVDIYREIAYVITISSICVALIFDIYKNILHRSLGKEMQSVVFQSIFVAMSEIMYLFMTKAETQFFRKTLLLCMFLYVIMMYIGRNLWKCVIRHSGKISQMQRAIILIASSEYAKEIVAKICTTPRGTICLTGVALLDSSELHRDYMESVPIIARGEKETLKYLRDFWVDEVLIHDSKNSISREFIEKCERMGIVIHQCVENKTSLYNVHMAEKFCGYMVVTSCIQSATNIQALCKRLIDIIGGIVGLFFTGVLTLIIGPFIYFASPGSIFFSQVRVGKGGRKFKMYKFRSMYADAEEKKTHFMNKNLMKGPMFKVENDSRIIGSGPDGKKKGLGWFIRKTSIDEFPQFWNVLKGEMSLVGTRPPTVDEWNLYDYHHRSRLAIKPGITGLWQVSGRNDITDFEEVVKLDMEYICNWSLWLDIKIILKTVKVAFFGRGAK